MATKVTSDSAILKAQKIHIDENGLPRYQYLPFEYKDRYSLMHLICPIHGEIDTSYNSHVLRKCGCDKCGHARSNNKTRLTMEIAIERAQKIHTDESGLPKYQYDITKPYKNVYSIMYGICPIHGEFSITYNNHVNNTQCGCNDCGKLQYKQTYLDKTGYSHPSNNPEVILKRENTYLDKTGYSHNMRNPKCVDNRENTYFGEHGVKNPAKNPEVILKKEDNYFTNHGVKNPSQKELIPILHLLDDPEWMHDQYITLKKTAQIISDELSIIYSVCSTTILKYLKIHNIELRENNQGFSYESCYMMETLSTKLEIQIQHALNGKEFRISGTRYSFDGYCKELNLGIEYNGSHTHGNPKKYKPEDQCHPHNDKTAHELQLKDKIRLANIRELGYNVFVVWDDEWKTSPQEVIMNLRNYINEIKLSIEN